MNLTRNKTDRLFVFAPLGLLFVLSVFYFTVYTSYLFFYQEKSMLFLVSFQYLAGHLNQPGGFLKYLGELQTALYYFPFLGAVLVAAEAIGAIVLLRKTGNRLTGKQFYFIPFAIGAALLFLQINYQFSSFNGIGIVVQLLLLFIAIKNSLPGKIGIAVFLSPLNYFLFGSFAILFFVAFSLFLILNKKRSWIKVIVLFLTNGVFFFLGKEFLFFQTTETLLQFPFSVQDIAMQLPLFTVVIVVISVLPVLLKVRLNWISSLSIKNFNLIKISPIIIISVLGFLMIQRIDKKNSHYFQVEKLFYEQKYDEVIRFNSQFPSTNILTNYLNNIALCETGRLSDLLFRFPQTSDGGTLFLKWEIVGEVLKRGGYFYYSIGMINEAQRWAYEYMVMRGNSPEVLKMLVKTELIKGNYKVAAKFISILEKSIFYRKDAAQFRKLLFNDSAVDADIELGAKRRIRVKSDFFIHSETPEKDVDLVLAADSTNQFAMEYKLAWLLLQKDMQGIVKELPNLEKMGYKRIPKNVEEAVVTYKLLRVGEFPQLKRLRTSTETEQRFQQFYQIFQQNQTNKQKAQSALARDFFDTYWYYVFFE